jgi:uncharacterized protein YvpB
LRPTQWAILLALGIANVVVFAGLLRLVAFPTDDAEAVVAIAQPEPTAVLVFPTLTPAPSVTPVTVAPPVAPTLRPEATLLVEEPRLLVPTLPPALAPPSQLPEEAAVATITGHAQRLSLSCEARSAADWAGYFGVAIDELTFLSQLPLSDDPDVGFVGDVRGSWGQTPPNDYGVHARPVARLLEHYGLPARSRRYMSLDDLRAEIAAGRPVITWVVGHVEAGGTPLRYTAGSGRETIVAPYEHTVIVIGYSPDTVTILDGARRYVRPLDVFVDSWGVLGSMAVVYTP